MKNKQALFILIVTITAVCVMATVNNSDNTTDQFDHTYLELAGINA